MINIEYNGYTNYETWIMANQIANNEALYNKVREAYFDGYKTYGTMLCIYTGRDAVASLPKKDTRGRGLLNDQFTIL